MAAHERYRTAERLLERAVTDMGEELGRVYNALSTQLSRLQITWNLYRQLYVRSQKRIDILNQTAGYFFGVLQRVLLDEALLHLGRMTDVESISKRENLTIKRLPSLVPKALRKEIEGLLAVVETAYKPMRLLRHRRIAHSDLQVAIGKDSLQGVSHAQIEATIAGLRAVLNRLELHYWRSETSYEHVNTPVGDADSLIYYLLKGIRAVERRDQRLREGKPLPEDLSPEENLP
jgi:hypothetical protein